MILWVPVFLNKMNLTNKDEVCDVNTHGRWGKIHLVTKRKLKLVNKHSQMITFSNFHNVLIVQMLFSFNFFIKKNQILGALC